jgi:hypothetical protein
MKPLPSAPKTAHPTANKTSFFNGSKPYHIFNWRCCVPNARKYQILFTFDFVHMIFNRIFAMKNYLMP